MEVKWVEHKGRKVLYVDCRSAGSDELVRLLTEARGMVMALPARVRILANIEGAAPSPGTMQAIRKQVDAAASRKVERLAVVGVSGVKKILMDAVTALFAKSETEIRVFKTEDEALKWLTE